MTPGGIPPAFPAVVAAARHAARLHPPPRAVWGVSMLVLGAAAMALGWTGWRRGRSLLPRNLAAAVFEHKASVIKRGAAASLLVGALLVGLGGATLGW